MAKSHMLKEHFWPLTKGRSMEHSHMLKEPPTKYRLELSRSKMCSHLLKEKTSKQQLVTDQ